MTTKHVMTPTALATLILLSLLPRSAGAQLTIECLAPLTADCSYGSDVVDLRLPVNVRLLQDGVPVAKANVAFTTTQCCLEPAAAMRASTDSTGIVSLVWAGKVPGAGAEVHVVGVRGSERAERRISISHRANAATGGVTELRQPKRRLIWYRDDQVPRPAEYVVVGPNDERSCEAVTVSFTPHLGGSAGPNPAQATWKDEPDTTRAETRFGDMAWAKLQATASPGRGACVVRASWRLAPVVGRQYLQATVVGADPSRPVSVATPGVARQGPRFTAGFAHFDVETKSGRKLDAIFGAELPLFWGRGPCLFLCDRLRMSIGTSFASPETDVFGGLVLAPLLFGPSRDAVPVQLSAAWVNGGRFAWVASFDASTVFSAAVTLLSR